MQKPHSVIMASRSDVGVLFTDIRLPGSVDGMELARLVNEQWSDVLLLITSGDAKPSEAQIADHGHFLAKPYTSDDVLREINDLAREADERASRAQHQKTGRR